MDDALSAQVEDYVNKGDYKSLAELAKQYRDGTYVAKDIDTAIAIDRAAYGMDRKIAPHYYDDLRKRRDRGDIEEAVSILLDPRNKGSEMKLRRASAYLHGYGIERDIEKGLAILKILSEINDKYALKYISAAIKFNSQSHCDSAYTMCKNLSKNSTEAKNKLATMYRLGFGTPRDLSKASETYAEIGCFSKAVSALLETDTPEFNNRARELLDNVEDSSDRYAFSALLEYRESGTTDIALEFMKTSALLKKPWCKEAMEAIASISDTPEWKYSVYSTFSDMSDRETSIAVLSHYPKDETKEGIHKVELHLLKSLMESAETVGVDVISDGGTLLGAVRHGGFIPWDDDIDVRMFEDDVLLLKDHLSKSCGDNYIIDAYAYGRLYKFYSVSYGGWIDIFPIQSLIYRGETSEVTGKRVSASDDPAITSVFYRAVRDTQPVASKSYFRETDVYPLKTMDLDGVKILAPRDTDTVLSSFYGEYYRLPKELEIHNTNNTNKSITRSFEKSSNISDYQ